MGDAEEIRRGLAKIERRGRGARYPGGLRQRIIDYCRAGAERGVGVKQVARELGLSWKTLSRWHSAAQKFHRVEVVATEVSPRRTHVLHGPRGTRVEGLGLDEVADLLRRLG